MEDDDDDDDDDNVPNAQEYHVNISDTLLFGLIIDYLAMGCIFRQTTHVLSATKERISLLTLGST